MAAIPAIGDIAVTTNLAAAAGAIGAMFTIWVVGKKPDVGMTANGALAGLVAITAGCFFVENWAAAVIGVLAGGLVVGSVLFFDRVKVDDPVGAVSVHAVCGAFGTLAVGLFASPRLIDAAGVGSPGLFYGGGMSQLGVQALGVVAVAAWALAASAIVFAAIKATVGLRVSAEEEIEGLDIGEHGMWGYPETFLGTDVAPSPDIVEKVRQEAKERAVRAEATLAVEPT
jgi:Amt family ammonium transporter